MEKPRGRRNSRYGPTIKVLLLGMEADSAEETALVSVAPSFKPMPKGCAAARGVQAKAAQTKSIQNVLFILPLPYAAGGAGGEFVAAVVVVVIGVALGPGPLHLVLGDQLVQLRP